MTPFSKNVYLGKFLRKKRKEKGYTIDQFAKMINHTSDFIIKYENGNLVRLNFDDLDNIFEILGFELRDYVKFFDFFSLRQRNNVLEPIKSGDMQLLLGNIILATDDELSFNELHFLIERQTVHGNILEPWVIKFYIKEFRLKKSFSLSLSN